MVRIGAAIAAVVLAVLLAWTIKGSLDPDPIVLPTDGVLHGAADQVPAGRVAQQVLRERALLQRWRDVPGVTSIEPVTAGVALTAEARDEEPEQMVAGWLARQEKFFEILRDRDYVEGIVNLPDPQAAVLQQPQGRDWRRLHNEQITYGGGWVIFGFSLLLAIFLAARGRIPLKEDFSGRTVRRFGAFERANHWFTATSFLMIAITGLILLYGQYLVRPWLGARPYSALATGSAYAHMAFMVPFVLGVLVMTAMWLRQNLPSRLDLQWLAKGGGFFSDKGENPPARRFNAGQKLIFWAVFWGALLLVLSGLSLMLPFVWLDIQGMQWAQAFHAAIGLIMIAVIIGHIYIGTVGMVGAFDAMWSGEVDRNWAKEHHSLWLAELEGSGPSPQHGRDR